MRIASKVNENKPSEAGEVDNGSLFGYPILDIVESAIVLHEWPEDFLRQKVVCVMAPRADWSPMDEWDGGGRWGWQPVKMDVAKLRTAFASPTIKEKKGGNIFSPCELKGTARRKEAVKAIYAMCFDVDNGQTEEDLIRRLEDFGACYVTYTSHSNGKALDSIPLKKLQEFDPSISDDPSDDDLRRFLAAPRNKKGSGNGGVGWGYWPSLVASARVTSVEAVKTVVKDKDGEPLEKEETVVRFKHDPMCKLRIVLPLAEPFVIDDSSRLTRQRSERHWKAAYIHVAEKIGVSYDHTCTDTTRGFFAARAKSLDNYRSIIGGTTPFVFPEVTPEMLKAAGLSSGGDKKTRAERTVVPQVEGMPDFDDFLWRHGHEFDAAGYIHALGWEMDGSPDPMGKNAIECPNDASHTSKHWPDDKACVVMNPDSADSGVVQIGCQHDGCKQRNYSTADYLRMIWQRQNDALAEGSDPLPSPESFLFIGDEDSDEGAASAAPNDNAAPKADSPASKSKRYSALSALLKSEGAKRKSPLARYDLKQKDGGAWVEALNKEDEPSMVCRAFEVLGMARSQGKSGWGLLIEFYDDDDHAHQALIDMGELEEAPNKVRARLVREGFKIFASPQMRTFENLLKLLNPSKRILTVNKPGWVSDLLYIAPNGEGIGNEESGETVRFDNPPLAHSCAGTLAGQLEAFNIALTHGGTHHLVGVIGGCAGVVVDFIELDTNPVVALTGGSRHGKSMSEYLAASAFGLPALTKGGAVSLIHTLDGTSNAPEAWAEMSNGSFLGLDEAQLYEGNLQKLVFKIASGSGRGRLDQNANLKKTRGWRLFAIISAEKGTAEMVEKFQKEHAAVGMTARLTDIDVTNEPYIPHDEMDRLETLLKANYGHVGPAFVRHLISSGKTPEAIRANINAHVRELVKAEASPLIRSAARVFGLLWEVGDIMQEAGLLPEGVVVSERIKAACSGYLLSSEAVALKPAQKAIETLRETLFAKRGNGVHELDSSDRQYQEALAWYKQEGDTMTFYVRATKIADLAGGALKQRALATALEEAGIAVRANKTAIMHTRLPGGEPMNLYKLTFDMKADYSAF
jgi:hypothetical protein